MARSIIYLVSSLIILLAVSIVSYAFVFSKSLSTNCDETRTDFTDISMKRPEEIVLQSLSSELSSTSTTSKSTTTTTTTTTSTSTTETAYFTLTQDYYSVPTTKDSFWGSDSYDYDSSTEIDDSDGWGFNWEN